MGNCCGSSNIIHGINQPRTVGGSKLTSKVLKNSDLWYERSMLLPHESARRVMFTLQQMFQYENLVPQWKRKLLSNWYNTYFFDFIHEHHDAEEQVLIPWLKTKINTVQDITKNAHEKLLTDLVAFKKEFENLASKKSISAKDVDVKKITVFCEFMNQHLDQEEEYWVPLIRDNFTEEEHDQIVGQIMQKAKKLETILMLVLNAMSEWATQDIYDQFVDQLPPPLKQALPIFQENYELNYIRAVSIICSSMENEPIGYVPGPTKITSRIIKNPKEWYEKSLLIPHEMIRRLMFQLQEMHTYHSLQYAWKRRLIAKWYKEMFQVIVQEHHDAEEKIYQPLLKQKVNNLKDIATEPHQKLLKQLILFETYFDNLAKKALITSKDIDIKGLNTFVEFMLVHLDQEEEYWPNIAKTHLTPQDEQVIVGQIMKQAARVDLLTAVVVDAMKDWETKENYEIFTTKALPPPVQAQLPQWIENYNNNAKRWYKLICSNIQDEPQDLNNQEQQL